MKIINIKPLPTQPNKYDTEYFELNIQGKFNKGEVRFLIVEELDKLTNK